jgi:glycosyltransferase involved in cell wall biosynthesis
MFTAMRLAVVIPCFRARATILRVLAEIHPSVHQIYVVDDACPDGLGALVQAESRDPRVHVIQLQRNSGVGGATIEGFLRAYQDGFDILIKIDADDQMDSRLIPAFVEPIQNGKADYVKGNRFFSPRSLKGMPLTRLIGNAGLSFLNKLSTGYWNMMDPTNGYIAIHRNLIPFLDLEKLEKRYFFESDLLFRLGAMRAVVVDVPIWSRYADETSHLSISGSLLSFPFKLLKRETNFLSLLSSRCEHCDSLLRRWLPADLFRRCIRVLPLGFLIPADAAHQQWYCDAGRASSLAGNSNDAFSLTLRRQCSPN